MQSQAAALQALSPQMPMLARACGRKLFLAFLVLVLAAALPLQPRSLAWASQISGRIVDTASFPLLGLPSAGPGPAALRHLFSNPAPTRSPNAGKPWPGRSAAIG